MTRMVACVRTAEEAGPALAGGADALEVTGSPDCVRDIVAAAGGRHPVIAVTSTPAAIADLVAAGADRIRLPWARGLSAPVPLLATVPAEPSAIAAALPAPGGTAPGYIGIVIDAADRLVDRMPVATLPGIVAACHAAGLELGLAGGLESPDVPRLLLLQPDMLLFSSALRDEAGELDRGLVRLIRGQIPQEILDGADYRLLAGRAEPRETIVPGDRIFVHDLVLPVSIGAYAHERRAPQSVRFNVDAVVAHARNPTDLRDVVSYDIIADGIRLIVASGHVPLVETLAERIAMMLLNHPRILRVTIRLEKLETGAGIVGVAIERSRAHRAALAPSEEQRG